MSRYTYSLTCNEWVNEQSILIHSWFAHFIHSLEEKKNNNNNCVFNSPMCFIRSIKSIHLNSYLRQLIDWLQFIQLWPHCFNCFRAKCNSNATTNQITRNLSLINLLLFYRRHILKWTKKIMKRHLWITNKRGAITICFTIIFMS